MAFARAVADKIEDMKKVSKGYPELPRVVPPALHTLTVLEWVESDVWGSAGLADLYHYLRGCNSLTIRKEWKPLFPKKLS